MKNILSFLETLPVDQGISSNSLQIIIFSKDRAFQLSQLLRGLRIFLGYSHPFCIDVIYKYSTKAHGDSYEYLRKLNMPHTKFHQEKSFKDSLFTVISSSNFNFVMFCVDDMVIYDHLNMDGITNLLLSSTNVFCFHTRLSPTITFSYTEQKLLSHPEFTVNDTFLQFCPLLDSPGEWNYPFDLSGGVYRRNQITKLIQLIQTEMIPLNTPNSLETIGSHLMSTQSNLFFPHPSTYTFACFTSPRLSIITINRVQTEYSNTIYPSQYSDTHSLLPLLYSNIQLDLQSYRQLKSRAVHIGDFLLQ